MWVLYEQDSSQQEKSAIAGSPPEPRSLMYGAGSSFQLFDDVVVVSNTKRES
jgi:hypothetical protein